MFFLAVSSTPVFLRQALPFLARIHYALYLGIPGFWVVGQVMVV